MDNENYISPNKITKQYDITSGTLRRWAEAGKIRCLRPNGGKRIYNIEDIKKIFNKNEAPGGNQGEDANRQQQPIVENPTPTGDKDIQNILVKLKRGIEENPSMDVIDHITNELNDIMVLINHMKQKDTK